MFKIGDEVFDNERGYGEGVIEKIDNQGYVFVRFKSKQKKESYCKEGRWLITEPITLFKKQVTKKYYYVGQKVSHQSFGDGVVTSITHNMKGYPIFVHFKESCKSFTIDGRYNIIDEFSSLSQKPHVPLELEEVVTFEKGELVWVKIQTTWQARYFSHQDNEKYYYYVNQQQSGETNYSKEIRNFTDNPLILNCYK